MKTITQAAKARKRGVIMDEIHGAMQVAFFGVAAKFLFAAMALAVKYRRTSQELLELRGALVRQEASCHLALPNSAAGKSRFQPAISDVATRSIEIFVPCSGFRIPSQSRRWDRSCRDKFFTARFDGQVHAFQ